MKFPKDWPSGCPHESTPEANGVVFRIVKRNPASHEDFLSHHETGRMPKASPCLRCGLSLFRLLEDALNQQKLLPRLGKVIASACLSSDHGKACATEGQQPTHTTWWPCEGVDRAKLFVFVLEVP
jgi:hypothetical protein